MKKLFGTSLLLLSMGATGWVAKLSPPKHHTGTVLRGVVEYVTPATQGVTVRLRMADQSPVVAYVGPDALTRPVRVRDHVALTGRMQGELFLVNAVELESALSEPTTYRVAVVREGVAYARTGNVLRAIPVGRGWAKDTVTVSWYGAKPVVE